MSSEANQLVSESKAMVWEGTVTDLTSFNTYGVVTLSNGKQANVQITLRHGLAPEQAYVDFKNFVKFLDLMAQDHEVVFWDGVRKYDNGSNGSNGATAKPSNGSTSTTSTESTGDKPKRNYKDPIPQGELPEEIVEVNEPVYAAEFDYFKVLPQPDKKATVEFWKDGLTYAVGAKMNKWKHDTIINALSKLTEKEINPAEANEYRIAGIQYWVKGNEYKYVKDGVEKTTNYKNLVLLKPAF